MPSLLRGTHSCMVETRFASPEGNISTRKAAKEVLGRLRFG